MFESHRSSQMALDLMMDTKPDFELEDLHRQIQQMKLDMEKEQK